MFSVSYRNENACGVYECFSRAEAERRYDELVSLYRAYVNVAPQLTTVVEMRENMNPIHAEHIGGFMILNPSHLPPLHYNR